MRGLNYSLAIVLLCFGFFIIPASVRAADDTPVIKEVRPKQVAAGGPELRIRVKGKADFKKSSVVLINNVQVTTQFQGGSLLAYIPQEVLAQPSTISVVVKTGNLMSAASSVKVIAPSNVEITAIRPRIVIAKSIGQNFGVEVQGENFNAKAVVRVGGVKTNTIIRRKGELSFVVGSVNAREVQLNGSVPIQVENGDGTISNTFNIIITPPGPNLLTVDPGSVDVSSSDTKVKLSGSNFSSSSLVFINGQLVSSTFKKTKKETFIEAIVPASMLTTVGQLAVKINNPNIGDSDTLLLDVTPKTKQPLIYSLDPVSVVAGSKDTELVVLGANLQNISQITINGTKVSKDDITEINKRALSFTVKEKNLKSAGALMVQLTNKSGASNTVPLTVEPAATITTVAGKLPGFVDGTGTSALFVNPAQAAVGPDGMIYIADQANHAIRRLNPSTNEVVTIAGDSLGRQGYVDSADIDDDHPTVRFSNPIGIAIDANFTFYITDFGNDVIRRMKLNSDGSVTVDTFAGRSKIVKNDDGTKERVGAFGFLDDVANLARFSGPYGIILDSTGNLLVTDTENNVIRKITIENGEAKNVSTILGNGFPGLSDGIGNSVQFKAPTGLFLRGDQLFVSDFNNDSIRVVDMNTNNVQTVVGVRRKIQADVLNRLDANSTSFGDGNRFFAVLNGPISATIDAIGRIYFIDYRRNRIRRVNVDGSVTSIIGGETDGFVDGAIPKARIRQARFLFFLNDDLYLVDSGNNRIRKIVLSN